MSAISTTVINLDRRPDRLADIGARLNHAGILWTRFSAIDARHADPVMLNAGFGRKSAAYPPLPGEMACALSHRAAWQMFLRSEARALCVLEDDVLFHPSLAALLADDSWITPAHGLIKLDLNSMRTRSILVSGTSLAAPPGASRLHRLWSRRLGGGAYVAHRDMVARLVAEIPKFRAAVDHHLFNPPYAPQFRDPGVHILVPAPVFHDHTGSDLAMERGDQKSGPAWRAIRRARTLENIAAIPGRARALLAGARFRKFGASFDPGERPK